MVRSFAPAGSITSVFGRSGVVVGQLGDYTAAHVTNAPAGGIAATTVQAAINELDTEKAANGHNHDATYAPLAHVGAGDNSACGGDDQCGRFPVGSRQEQIERHRHERYR